MPYKDKEKDRIYKYRWQKKNREWRKERGLCLSCNNPVFENHVYCLFHLERHNRLYRDRLRNNKEQEAKHNMASRSKQLDNITNNKCKTCGMPLNIESRIGQMCVNCSLKRSRLL